MKIDLKHAYHLVWITNGNEYKMAFCMCYGSFKWTVMLFGLSNAPAAFQWFINKILGDLQDVFTIGYLDNILIYSDSINEHQLHVSKILCHLWNARLYANPKKCEFHTDAWVLFYPWKDFIWTPLKWMLYSHDQNPKTFVMYSPFWDSQISTDVSSTSIQR